MSGSKAGTSHRSQYRPRRRSSGGPCRCRPAETESGTLNTHTQCVSERCGKQLVVEVVLPAARHAPPSGKPDCRKFPGSGKPEQCPSPSATPPPHATHACAAAGNDNLLDTIVTINVWRGLLVHSLTPSELWMVLSTHRSTSSLSEPSTGTKSRS